MTFLAIGTPVKASTYYVASTGSDSGTGTKVSPFQSIQFAANLVQPGDTVIVESGVYNCGNQPAAARNPCTGGENSGSTLVNLTHGGTADNPVTFIASGSVVLDGGLTTTCAAPCKSATAEGVEFGANYVNWIGFQLQHFTDSALSNYRGGQYIDVSQNTINDVGAYCTSTSTGRDAVFVSASNFTLERTLIHDIGRLTPSGSCSESNANYQNHDHGVYIDAGSATITNVVVKNNVFYNIGHGWGVQFYSGGRGTVANSSIVNNTFAFANPYRDGQIVINENLTNVNIENNIFYQATRAGIAFYGAVYTYSNITVANNLSSNSLLIAEDGGSTAGLHSSGNLLSANPEFANASTFPYDFHLSSSSPAIGTGLPVTDTLNDFAGSVRPDPPAAGAYQ